MSRIIPRLPSRGEPAKAILLGLITHQSKEDLYEKTIKLYISNYNDNQLHSNVFNIKPSRFFI